MKSCIELMLYFCYFRNYVSPHGPSLMVPPPPPPSEAEIQVVEVEVHAEAEADVKSSWSEIPLG